jgi:exopolyphosphatase/guanosine-5'-triphosphate,3'-diphosphate pyrophosphatase
VEVAADELEALIGLLSRMSPEQRRRVPGIRPERADIIVPGLAVIAELLGRVAAPAATISGFGLRDGLLLEMIESGGEARA